MSVVATATGGVGDAARRLEGTTAAAIVQGAALPPELAELVLRVTGRRGFWNAERCDIARELAAHFLDGVEAGSTPQALAASFGDPPRVSRLMLRACRAKRPLAWRALSLSIRGFLALCATIVILYAVLAARYFAGSPTITSNPVREFNTRVEATPIDQRAWPEYRKVLMAMGKEHREIEHALLLDGLDPGTVVSPSRANPSAEERAAYLRSLAPHLARIRELTLRPHMGYRLTMEEDTEFRLATEAEFVPSANASKPSSQEGPEQVLGRADNPWYFSVLLPHLGQMRRMTRLLVADARLAAREGDGHRAAEDLLAIVRMANQNGEPPCLIAGLVSTAFGGAATNAAQTIIAEQPGLFSDDELVQLSHAFATFRGAGSIETWIDGERTGFLDLLQRVFTDNGSGDGRLTPGAMRALTALNDRADGPGFAEAALGPVTMALLAGRAEQLRTYDTMVNSARTWAATPPWLRRGGATDADTLLARASPLWRAQYWPVQLMVPAFTNAVWVGERGQVEREATCVVIALELHKRRHGTYPATLAQIEATLLPRVPLDPFDGKPIKYRLDARGPVLYSTGADRKDDAGLPPPPFPPLDLESGNVAASRWLAPDAAALRLTRQPTSTDPSIDGDWVLWPPERQKRGQEPTAPANDN